MNAFEQSKRPTLGDSLDSETAKKLTEFKERLEKNEDVEVDIQVERISPEEKRGVPNTQYYDNYDPETNDYRVEQSPKKPLKERAAGLLNNFSDTSRAWGNKALQYGKEKVTNGYEKVKQFSKEKFQKASKGFASAYKFSSQKAGSLAEKAKEKRKQTSESFKRYSKHLSDRLNLKSLTKETYEGSDKLLNRLKKRDATYSERLEDEKALLKTLSNKDEKKELKNSIKILEERRRIVQERTKKLEKLRTRYEERKLDYWERLGRRSNRTVESIKKWGSKKENWYKLGKKVAISAAITSGLGALGVGVGVGAWAAGLAGGTLGQKLGAAGYEKLLRRDFRSELLKLRRKGYQNITQEQIASQQDEYDRDFEAWHHATTPEEKEAFTASADKRLESLNKLYDKKADYQERLNKLASTTSLGRKVTQRKWEKIAASMVGGVIGSGVARLSVPLYGMSAEEIQAQYDNLDQGNIDTPDIEKTVTEPNPIESSTSDVPEGTDNTTSVPNEVSSETPTTPETSTEGVDTTSSQEVPEESLTPESPSTESQPNLEDIYIKKGEGVTHAFMRQIEHSQELKDYFELGENPSHKEVIRAAAKAARETGYISDTGEIRVIYGQGAGYELQFEGDHLKVIEHSDIKYDDVANTFEAGETHEVHTEGESSAEFEAEDYESKREYLHSSESAEPTQATKTTDVPVNDNTRPASAEPIDTSTDGGFTDIGSNESTVNQQHPGFTEVAGTGERYIPGIQSLGVEKLRDYGMGSAMSQARLPESLGSGIIPEKIIALFQNPKYPDLWMQIDNPQESKLIFEAMGIEENTAFGVRAPFRSVVTGQPVTFEDIYERVNLEKLKQEVERLKRVRGIAY